VAANLSSKFSTSRNLLREGATDNVFKGSEAACLRPLVYYNTEQFVKVPSLDRCKYITFTYVSCRTHCWAI